MSRADRFWWGLVFAWGLGILFWIAVIAVVLLAW